MESIEGITKLTMQVLSVHSFEPVCGLKEFAAKLQAKQKTQGMLMFKTKKSGNKTRLVSKFEHKVMQVTMLGRMSMPTEDAYSSGHLVPVANVLWKPRTIR